MQNETFTRLCNIPTLQILITKRSLRLWHKVVNAVDAGNVMVSMLPRRSVLVRHAFCNGAWPWRQQPDFLGLAC